MRSYSIASIAILAFVIIGCAPSQSDEQYEESARSTPTSTAQGDNMPTSSAATPIDPGFQLLIDQAIMDLSQRLSIPASQINLVEAKSVVWPDSSLGCPQPGMAYLQVPEDGALIILQFNGVPYEYHNGGNRGLFLCEKNLTDLNPTQKIDLFNLTPSKSDPLPTTPDNSIPPGEDT